ncbi:MAG: hypothetical protein COS25_01590 [Candidatus Nealsonbacteria bacterium CG02_land_8_20_14_3_00_37_10]|uniref:Uncharacterized protein n=2 Tax=Candidatus Nealsoniibacteriota TaxID=1817911 RepID=A0A2G9YYB5_9BACT|nr:MAG: hypothetical protein COX35_01965 [Candidatus Nealsonbacteria bacterium CG23_combo_of_CG06-09_8_20_14_all_37_18]PIV45103.1 MAG: hypothetical protein COS25_01590 [Candidatus Nealsonbacteria bacterium CG02_land_8_20_14_3_00_37_10]
MIIFVQNIKLHKSSPAKRDEDGDEVKLHRLYYGNKNPRKILGLKATRSPEPFGELRASRAQGGCGDGT